MPENDISVSPHNPVQDKNKKKKTKLCVQHHRNHKKLIIAHREKDRLRKQNNQRR